jgi:tetratricopeptide (TPR) repeat protein
VHSGRGEHSEALECFEQAANEHRAIGYRFGLSQWLEGTAWVLLELAETRDAMPEYLPKHLPDVPVGSWKAFALQTAREHAEECLVIARDLSKPDTLFSSRVLLARIAAAEGDNNTAVHRLNVLLDEASNDAQRAELHYRLLKLNATDTDHRAEALRLYQSLIEQTPKREYSQRIKELTATSEPPTSEADDATE